MRENDQKYNKSKQYKKKDKWVMSNYTITAYHYN